MPQSKSGYIYLVQYPNGCYKIGENMQTVHADVVLEFQGKRWDCCPSGNLFEGRWESFRKDSYEFSPTGFCRQLNLSNVVTWDAICQIKIIEVKNPRFKESGIGSDLDLSGLGLNL